MWSGSCQGDESGVSERGEGWEVPVVLQMDQSFGQILTHLSEVSRVTGDEGWERGKSCLHWTSLSGGYQHWRKSGRSHMKTTPLSYHSGSPAGNEGVETGCGLGHVTCQKVLAHRH